ncbi:hypothetical protein M422DRAFT_248826 [Sphaerobolus stellatus SS14]|nr:hypothetical protein M422DRAFT_248826 [Sphaerobolus stellatus SS14]
MTSFDLTHFGWREDLKVAGRLVREPVGELIEDVWNMIYHGEQNLFLGIYVENYNPLSTSDLISFLRLYIAEEGRPLPRHYMVYDVAKSSADTISDTLSDKTHYRQRILLTKLIFTSLRTLLRLSESSSKPLRFLSMELVSRFLERDFFTTFLTTLQIPHIENRNFGN